MKKKEEILYHRDCINIIRWLKKRKWGSFFKPSSLLHGKKAIIVSTEKRMSIKFKHHITKDSFKKIELGRTLRNITFQPTNPAHHLRLNEIYLHSYSPPSLQGFIHSFQSSGFSRKRAYYFKLIIPVSKVLNFYNHIEPTNFTSDLGVMSWNCVTAIIDGAPVLACSVKDKETGETYLAIEAKQKLPFSSFKDKAHAVRNALGYLTGYLAGTRGYYFAFSDHSAKIIKGFYCTEIRPEIKSSYSPMNSNPFAWIRGNKSEARHLYEKKLLRNISHAEFSTLCQRVHDNIEFTSVLLLIIESSIASLIFMPGGFAIALEMISDIIAVRKRPA